MADGQSNTGNGLMATIVAIFSAYITVQSVQWFVAVLASCAAILASVMAVRYYYYATKKVK